MKKGRKWLKVSHNVRFNVARVNAYHKCDGRFLNSPYVMLCFVHMQNVLLSDSSSDDDLGHDIKVTDADIRCMLRNHVREKKAREEFRNDPEVSWCKGGSAPLVGEACKYAIQTIAVQRMRYTNISPWNFFLLAPVCTLTAVTCFCSGRMRST